jgi:glycosyltransferase involved in cell wall biosynthesis
MASLDFIIPKDEVPGVQGVPGVTELFGGVLKIRDLPKKENPTICFACVCKNEEKCITTALESVYKFISYWVICDTGSTDKTCEVIEAFFKEKGIPGELFHEDWVNFGHNKTILFDRCYKKADYILHFDADDYFVGDLKFKSGCTQYHVNVKKNSINYPCLLLFDCNYKWKFCGVAHTTIKCLDCKNVTTGSLVGEEFYMYSTPDTGARSFDPDKYKKDAEKLRQQFFDTLIFDPDNLNKRSIFYTAQSYKDHGDHLEAAKWYNMYLKFKDTWIEEQYIAYMHLGSIYKILKYENALIEQMYINAMTLIDDRAEAYLALGTFYNQTRKFEQSYNTLLAGKDISFNTASKKYFLFLDDRAYGKYILDELSVACYWLNKLDEGKKYLSQIIDDPDFERQSIRLNENMKHFNRKIEDVIKNTNVFSFD